MSSNPSALTNATWYKEPRCSPRSSKETLNAYNTTAPITTAEVIEELTPLAKELDAASKRGRSTLASPTRSRLYDAPRCQNDSAR